MSFISYKFGKYLGNNRAEYTITDTDFVDENECLWKGYAVEVVDVTIATINTYKCKALPIVPNMIRAWCWYNKFFQYTIEQDIDWNTRYNPIFIEYAEETDRYLNQYRA